MLQPYGTLPTAAQHGLVTGLGGLGRESWEGCEVWGGRVWEGWEGWGGRVGEGYDQGRGVCVCVCV